MQVRAAVDEADIGNVQKGQRVSFGVDAFLRCVQWNIAGDPFAAKHFFELLPTQRS
jgi:hypothetical protein